MWTGELPWRSGRSRRSRRSGANQKALGGGVRKMALVRTGCPRAMGCLPHPRRLRTRVLALGRVGQRMERRAKRFRGDLIRPPARATSRTSHSLLLLRPLQTMSAVLRPWLTLRTCNAQRESRRRVHLGYALLALARLSFSVLRKRCADGKPYRRWRRGRRGRRGEDGCHIDRMVERKIRRA